MLDLEELMWVEIRQVRHDWTQTASKEKIDSMVEAITDTLDDETRIAASFAHDVAATVTWKTMRVLHERVEKLKPPMRLWISRRGRCNAICMLVDYQLFYTLTKDVGYTTVHD